MNNSKKTDDLRQTKPSRRVDEPYSAITLDACIYDKMHYRFDSGLLANLRGLSVQTLLSSVVMHEVEDHLNKKKSEALKGMKEATKGAGEWNLFTADEEEQINLAHAMIRKSNPVQKWHDYIEANDIEIVDEDYCRTPRLVESYFTTSPPFNEGNKKYEFPDAIALFSLEKWAKENGKKILAISDDEDWIRFSNESDYIDVVSILQEGLARIESATQEIQDWILWFTSFLNNNESEYFSKIDDSLVRATPEHEDVEVDEENTHADSSSFDVTELSIEYIEGSISFPSDAENLDPIIIDNRRNSAKIIISASIEVSAFAEIQYYNRDQHDYYEDSGSSQEYIESIRVPIRLLISFGDIIGEKEVVPNIEQVSILDTISIPFGDISPDD